MPAFARVSISGIPYHVTQRGNYRQDVFATEQDRVIYLEYVASAALEYGLELHGWCLMTNHVHWIVLPKRERAMAQSFRRAHSRFARYINRQHKRAAGHLWQGRYYSCPLDGIDGGLMGLMGTIDGIDGDSPLVHQFSAAMTQRETSLW